MWFSCVKYGARVELTFILGSSADINPIGSISKVDLKRFIAWASKDFDMPILEDFIHAIPTAELEPITSDYVSISTGEAECYTRSKLLSPFSTSSNSCFRSTRALETTVPAHSPAHSSAYPRVRSTGVLRNRQARWRARWNSVI